MTLPVPIRFQLPGPEWESVAPASLGVHNAEFLAVRRDTDPDYDPTITISGDWRTDPATLEQIADEAVANLRGQADDVEVATRRQVGSDAAPAIVQELGATAAIGGRRFDLRQAQALMSLKDTDDPSQRVVVIYTLTCTYQQFRTVGPEFQTFLASLEVQPGAQGGPDSDT